MIFAETENFVKNKKTGSDTNAVGIRVESHGSGLNRRTVSLTEECHGAARTVVLT